MSQTTNHLEESFLILAGKPNLNTEEIDKLQRVQSELERRGVGYIRYRDHTAGRNKGWCMRCRYNSGAGDCQRGCQFEPWESNFPVSYLGCLSYITEEEK